MATSEINYPNSYNRELILDLTLEAWSVYEMDHPGYPRIHDYIPIPGYYIAQSNENVYDSSGVLVTDSTGNPVTVERDYSLDRTTDDRLENFKFLVSQGVYVSLAEYRDYTFTDWVSFDTTGVDFSSYLLTGYNLAGSMARQKQVMYLQVFCERTEKTFTASVLDNQSSCMVKSEWNWNTSAAQGKWGTSFQAYRFLRPYTVAASGDFDYGEKVIVTKNKLRGRGKALSLLIESSTGKDMKLLGWNTITTINGEP